MIVATMTIIGGILDFLIIYFFLLSRFPKNGLGYFCLIQLASGFLLVS